VIPSVINIMNNVRKKRTVYRWVYGWILPTIFNIVGNVVCKLFLFVFTNFLVVPKPMILNLSILRF
jgi:formate/nitrite transporter FocA (FNT family)